MRALGRPTHTPTIPSPAPQDHDDNLDVPTETHQDSEVLHSPESRESSENAIPVLSFTTEMNIDQQQQQVRFPNDYTMSGLICDLRNQISKQKIS